MTRLLVLTTLLASWSGTVQAQSLPLSEQEIHDRIVAVLVRNARRPVPAGDTLVTWSPIPNLYTTVSRSGGDVRSSLVRADSFVGTASSTWRDGRLTSASVQWTKLDSSLLDIQFAVHGDSLYLTGTRFGVVPIPPGPWAVSDYGMEDQRLPLYETLSGTTTVSVFRPFTNRWDSLTVTATRTDSGTRVEERHRDGETFSWLISRSGLLVRLTRSRYSNFERRPLERTPAFEEYRRLVPRPGK